MKHKPCPPKIKRERWPTISRRIRMKWWNTSVYFLRCAICSKLILEFDDLVPDHIQPGKMGGCKDHSEANLQPAHWWCNSEKGSKRVGGRPERNTRRVS